MASQQAPGRPWFRLPSMNRPRAPAPATLPQPQPPARQPRPPFVRPTPAFRPPPPVAQPQHTQSQALAPPSAPPVAAAPPATTSPPPQPPVTTSVPSSPIIKVSSSASSLTTSPAAKPSPKSTLPSVATSSSVPPSPNNKLLSAASSSLPTSPAPKVMSPPAPPSHLSAATTTTTTFNARAATPTSSPKIISPLAKNSTLSPEMKPVSTPPSPLILPPAQIKFDGKPETKIPAQAQQKTILMQETFEEHKVIPNTSISNFRNHVNVVHNGESQVKINTETKDHKGFYKKYSDSEDFGGENRGAIMELSLHKKGNPIALISNAQKSERDSIEEGRSKMNDKTHKMVSPLKKTTFINSNVQGVNSSILLDCSFSNHDPGVHLSPSSKSNGGRGAQHKD